MDDLRARVRFRPSPAFDGEGVTEKPALSSSLHDERYMEVALDLARGAQVLGEPPFGALIVDRSGRVVAQATDEVRRGRDLTLHAEVNAVRHACRILGPDLSGCALFSTVEPCPMCFTAAWLARLSRVVFGCTMDDVHLATAGQQRELRVPASRMNAMAGARLELIGGVLASRCHALFAEDGVDHTS